MDDNYILRKNDSVDVSKWHDMVSGSPYATPFQTPQFYHFCCTVSRHQGMVCAIEGKDHKYHALCVADIVRENGVKSYFSRRAIIYGGPLLLRDNQNAALEILLENLHNELKDQVIYIEIRNFKDYSPYRAVFVQQDWKYIPGFNVRNKLDFQNLNDLTASFKYNRRREINQTIKSGLTYREIENEADLTEIYGILRDLYKNRTGLPLPSLQYFTALNHTGLLKVFKVTDRDFIVGGSFCLVLKNEAIFTYYYCGKRVYKPKVYPTHLAVLAAMEYGIKNKMKYLDFMGAGKPGMEYGVRNYKLEYGGELVEEGRYLKAENKFLYHLGTMVINFRKRRKMNSRK